MSYPVNSAAVPGVGTGTSHDQLGPVQRGSLLQHVVVDDASLLVQPVRHGLQRHSPLSPHSAAHPHRALQAADRRTRALAVVACMHIVRPLQQGLTALSEYERYADCY